MSASVSGTDTMAAGDAAPVSSGQSNASATAWVVAKAKFDNRNREVTISSPTIEPSYAKAYDVNGNVIRQQWFPNPDGSMYVDSAMSWGNVHNDAQWQAIDTFTARAANFTNPTYTWAGSFDPAFNLGQNMNQASVTVQHDLGYNLPTAPITNYVQVAVQDGPGTDGATAVNTYTVTWHLPYQPTDFIGATRTKKKIQFLAGPIFPGGDILVQQSDAQDIEFSAVFDAGAAITELVPATSELAGFFKIAAALANVGGYKYHKDGQNSYSGGQNTPASGNWGYAFRDMGEIYTVVAGSDNTATNNISPPGLAGDPNNQGLCKLWLYMVEKDTAQSWHADKYTVNGFDSAGHIISTTNCDMIEMEPFFIQYKNPDGTPIQ